jgi:hypothetical protein
MGRQCSVLQLRVLWEHWKEIGSAGERVEKVITRLD